MKKKIFRLGVFLLHIFFPLAVGGLIYVLFRTEDLLMFRWFESVGVSGFVKAVRSSFLITDFRYPYWLVFCLPNALWIYSLTSYLILMWKDDRGKLFWFALGPAIGIASEVMQINGLFPGTFDSMDLAFTAVFSFIPFATIRPFRKEI